MFLISCVDIEIKPPAEDLSALICGRGIECSLTTNEQLTACLFCMDCFFSVNGGKDKWWNLLGSHLDARCPVVVDLNKVAHITECIDVWREGYTCGKQP